MRTRWPLIAAVVGAAVLAAGIVAVVGFAFGGSSGSTASKAQYEQTVVDARDRIDFALARIGKSQSIDQLIQRIDDASNTVGKTALQLQEAKVASGFGDENKKLVLTLQAFSTELANTASTFSDPTMSAAVSNLTSLSFPQWDKVNAILTDLHDQGIEVQPLARH